MFPARNSAKVAAYVFWVDCLHGFVGSKYLILLKNLLGRDANLVLLETFENLNKMLKP